MNLISNKRKNLRRCFGLIAFCIFFISARPPKDILSAEKMVELFTELELAKAASNYNKAEEEAKIFFASNKIEIYAKYDISPEVFEKSYTYYMDRPEEFLAIYNDVVLKLEALL